MVLSNEYPDVKNSIYLYPNPTTGPIFLKLPQNEDIEVYLSDNYGKTIKVEKSVFTSTTTIDLSQFKRGLYIINFKDKNTGKCFSQKKVIKN